MLKVVLITIKTIGFISIFLKILKKKKRRVTLTFIAHNVAIATLLFQYIVYIYTYIYTS